MNEAFPGNSRKVAAENTGPEPAEEQPTHESVVQGRVIRRKKPLGRRLKETFFAADAETVIGFVVQDVIVPAIKSLVRDVVSEGIERAFNGSSRPRSTIGSRFGSNNQTRVSYNTYATRPTSAVSSMSSGLPTARRPADQRDAMDLGEIIVERRVEAEDIINSLLRDIETYKRATVGALYSLIGQTPVFTDHRWGWRDLTDADIRRVSGGYLLLLPPVEDLR